MNLQERLERILDERRGYVVGHEPGPEAALEGLLMTCTEGALGADNRHDRDGWLVRLAGLALYALHPEDDLAHVTVDSLPLPPSQGMAIAHAFTGLNPGMVVGEPGSAGRPVDDGPGEDCGHGMFADPDATVHQRGDGRWRRKPRPDRV